MIAAPENDHTCLSQITDVVRELVQQRDPAFLELAEKYPTTEALIEYLRSLPQRNDDGDPEDGPRAEACEPTQRIRLSPIPHDPNCVERAAIYVGVAELIDPNNVRQLKTEMTKWGLHTFPVENCKWDVVLDPDIPRNALRAYRLRNAPLGQPINLSDAIDMLISIGQEPASLEPGGPERLDAAHEALRAMFFENAELDELAIDDIAYACALALQHAPHFGAAGRVLTRELVRAIGSRMNRYAEPMIGPATPMCDGAEYRNAFALEIGPYTIRPDMDVISALGRVGARLGMEVGTTALQRKLASVGLSPMAMSALEHEFNREGITLGPLAPRTPSLAALYLLPTLSSLTAKSAATPATTAAAAAQTATGSLAAVTTKDVRNSYGLAALAAIQLVPTLYTLIAKRPAKKPTATATAATRTADTAAGSLAAPATTQAPRNSFVATPGMILAEMDITDTDITALGRDIRDAFRRPFEQQLAAAEARFEREFGRAPGMGRPSKGPGDPGIGLTSQKTADGRHVPAKMAAGVNDFVSAEKDYGRVYAYMSPLPTAGDIQWKSYQGNFVHNWGEFESEWRSWYQNNKDLGARMWGSTRDTALDYRKKAQAWRDKFLSLPNAVSNAPAPQMPTPPAFLPSLSSGLKTAAIAAGAVAAAAIVLPAVLRR